MTSKVGEMLLKRPRPYQDEILVSYIIRLALDNSYDWQWILELAGLQRRKSIYTGRLLDQKDDLSLLSYITETSEETLKSMAFSKVEGDKNYVQVSSTIRVPLASIQFAKLRVCTQCLIEAKYIRKVWSFIPVTVCPIHSCLLINKCPGCNAFLSWNTRFISPETNLIATCKSCGFDLCKSSSQCVSSNEESVLSKYIYETWGSTINIKHKSIENNNPILNLETESVYWIVSFFAMQFLIPGSFQLNILLELDNAHLHDLIVRAYLLFENLQSNYYFFIKWMKYQYRPHSMNLKGTKSTRLHGLYKVFKRNINRVFQPETYPFLIFDSDEYFEQIEASLIHQTKNFMRNRTSFIERYVDSEGSLIKYELEEKPSSYQRSFDIVFDPSSKDNKALMGKGKRPFRSAVEICLERMRQETENPDL